MKVIPRVAAAAGIAAVLASSCTTLREIPREQYTARAERKNISCEPLTDKSESIPCTWRYRHPPRSTDARPGQR